MPARSRSQLRYLFWAEKHGKVPAGTAEEFAAETPDIASLPERVRPKKGGHKRKIIRYGADNA